MSATPARLLEVRELSVSFGGIEAVKGVALDVAAGELVTLIGANGAGKTTILKAITGTLPAARFAGQIRFDGEPIDALPAHLLPSRGLAMVPEGRGVFARMTIRENLMMGAYSRRDIDAVAADIDHWFSVFPRLKEREAQLAGTLSGGEQQMLAMARALMSRPKLLLLDEPSMGLAPIMVERIFEVVQTVAREGVTILLVEQNVRKALSIATRGYVMDSGRLVLHGDAADLLQDPRVAEAYLGA